MTYTLTIATEATRDLVVDALRTAADQRTRVARGAARLVAAAKADGADVRSRSVKVTALLAEAGELAELADELAATEDLALVVRYAVDDTLVEADTPTVVGDDGTSAQAQALAELAGLEPADPDAVEDPVTGALPEDEPRQVEEVLG